MFQKFDFSVCIYLPTYLPACLPAYPSLSLLAGLGNQGLSHASTRQRSIPALSYPLAWELGLSPYSTPTFTLGKGNKEAEENKDSYLLRKLLCQCDIC